MLYRALRGSGPGGLAGILPVTAEGLVRPLLGVSRAWVLEWNRAHGLEWREDASNADPRFRRNALRRILPELGRLVNPAAPEALARLAGIALDEEADWRARTEEAAARVWSPEEGDPLALAAPVDALASHGPALTRRLLRHALESVRGSLRSIDHAHVEQVLLLAGRRRGDGRIQLPGAWAERSCGWLRIAAAPPAPVAEITVRGPRAAAILRGWRPGDQFDGRPFRDRLRRRNIPRWRRPRWPVLASGSDLLWAEGFGCSAAGVEAGWPAGISLSEIRSLSI